MSVVPLTSSIMIDGLPPKTYCEDVMIEYEIDEIDACFWAAKRAVFDIYIEIFAIATFDNIMRYALRLRPRLWRDDVI